MRIRDFIEKLSQIDSFYLEVWKENPNSKQKEILYYGILEEDRDCFQYYDLEFSSISIYPFADICTLCDDKGDDCKVSIKI